MADRRDDRAADNRNQRAQQSQHRSGRREKSDIHRFPQVFPVFDRVRGKVFDRVRNILKQPHQCLTDLVKLLVNHVDLFF